MQTMIGNLADRTGHTLEEWLDVVACSDLRRHGDIIRPLKGEHGVTHGYANLIATRRKHIPFSPP